MTSDEAFAAFSGRYETQFTVSYQGPALDDHAIDVQDLAPALLGLEQTFDRANYLLNGERARITLQVRATPSGSFEILFELKQVLDGAFDVFSGDFFTSAANLKGLLLGTGGTGIGSYSLLRLRKFLRNRKASEISKTNNGVLLEVEEHTSNAASSRKVTLLVSEEVLKLHQDETLRQNIEAVVAPVLNEGFRSIEFRDGNTELESVDKEDVRYFGPPERSDEVTEQKLPSQQFKIVRANFSNTGKWYLHDGTKPKWYTIVDQAFKRRVQLGSERFGAGDLLECESKVVSTEQDGGLPNFEYEITRVVRHISRAQQGSLDI